MNSKGMMLAAAWLAVLAGPALAADELPGKAGCMFTVNVRGWQVLDEQTLIVEAPSTSQRYLVKLFAPSTGLQFQEVLGFEDGDHNQQLCGQGDYLRVGRPMPQTTPIAAVRLLSKEEAEALLAAKRARK